MLNHTRTDGVGLHMRSFFLLRKYSLKGPNDLDPNVLISNLRHILCSCAIWAAGKQKQTLTNILLMNKENCALKLVDEINLKCEFDF